ncbi:MAG: amidohydrolase family protein, partial [Pirellula sp.]
SNGNYLPGFGAHRELDAFVRGGIPAADAIRIGTIHGARALKIDADHGSIEPGKIADLLVVEGTPLENIRNTRKVQWVATRGQLYSSEALLNQARGKLGPNNDEEQDAW